MEHWDFVITCFEPLDMVTGGIGTYTRMLIPIVAEIAERVLVITNKEPSPELALTFHNSRVRFISVGDTPILGSSIVNNMSDHHASFSYLVYRKMRELQCAGTSFGCVEFSDYGRDGYYAIKARRLGLLHYKFAIVRIHSPDIMLFEDNRRGYEALDLRLQRIFKEEMYCYRYCDFIIYGGESIRERLRLMLENNNPPIFQTFVKVPHPFPTMTQTLPTGGRYHEKTSRFTIGLIGRLEARKGCLLFVETILQSEACRVWLKQNNVEIRFIGRDTDTAEGGGSMLKALTNLIDRYACNESFAFAGYLNQKDLIEVCMNQIDMFIFPSLYENYPNALIETLWLGRPTIVSSRGCMPEVAHLFSHVTSYDPLSTKAASILFGFMQTAFSKVADSESKAFEHYSEVSASHNKAVQDSYRQILARQMSSQQTKIVPPVENVDFVIPHFNNSQYLSSCIKSILQVGAQPDQIIVVDDFSSESERSAVVRICNSSGVVLKLLDENSGPSNARNVGAAEMRRELIQFIDADDLLHVEGFLLTLAAMELNADIDMLFGLAKTFGASDHVWAPRDSDFNALEQNYSHSAVLIRRLVFESLNGFDCRMRSHYEDWEFNARFALSSYVGEMIPEVTFYYRTLPKSRTRTNPEREAASLKQVRQFSVEYVVSNKNINPSLSEFARLAAVYLTNWRAAADWISTLERRLGEIGEPEQIISKLLQKLSVLEDRNRKLSAGATGNIFNSSDLKLASTPSDIAGALLGLVLQRAIQVTKETHESERMRLLERSGLFDPTWYLRTYADVRQARVNPMRHFLTSGWKEYRAPREGLEVIDLFAIAPDCLAQDVNPLCVIGAIYEMTEGKKTRGSIKRRLLDRQ